MSGISNNSNSILKSLEIESNIINSKQDKKESSYIKDLLLDSSKSKDSLSLKAKSQPSAIQSISIETYLVDKIEIEAGASATSVKSIKNQEGIESAWVGNIQSNQNRSGNGETAIIIPKCLDYNKPINLLYYFHGWNGSIANSINETGKEMINYAKNSNSIIIIPKGAQQDINDKKSWFLEKGQFEKFNKDILEKLETKLPQNANIASLELTGHSAGGLAVRNCLQGSSGNFSGSKWNNINISTVGFIDASYGTRATDSYNALSKLNPNANFKTIFLQNTDTALDSQNISAKANVTTIRINQTIDKIDHNHTRNKYFSTN